MVNPELLKKKEKILLESVAEFKKGLDDLYRRGEFIDEYFDRYSSYPIPDYISGEYKEFRSLLKNVKNLLVDLERKSKDLEDIQSIGHPLKKPRKNFLKKIMEEYAKEVEKKIGIEIFASKHIYEKVIDWHKIYIIVDFDDYKENESKIKRIINKFNKKYDPIKFYFDFKE